MGKLADLLRRPLADPTATAHARAVGRRLAWEGTGVGEALRTLRTQARARGREPRDEEVEALVEGWADTTLGHLHRLTCEDPLTGLATVAHLRTRVAERRRAGVDLAQAHALVVVSPGGTEGDRPAHDPDSLRTALWGAALGERVRVVFGEETIACTASGRVVVLADQDHRLEGLVALLRRLLLEDGYDVTTLVHPLPEGELELVLLLERLDALPGRVWGGH